jgi:hypothetical protein
LPTEKAFGRRIEIKSGAKKGASPVFRAELQAKALLPGGNGLFAAEKALWKAEKVFRSRAGGNSGA